VKILIKNGCVIDPSQDLDRIADILLEDGKVRRISHNIKVNGETFIDAAGKIVMPGIVDMHVHLREPGREDKETVVTGTRAALKGGVTSVLAMPNTSPAMDSPENILTLKDIIARSASNNVFICAAITKERLGGELTDIAKLKKSGAVAISDDGSSVDNEQLMLAAMQKAKKGDIPVICHCEDRAISDKGTVNLGVMSTRLGLRGIPSASEYKRVERDIRLAQKAGCRLHIAHVSCKESVEMIAKAKKKGIGITAETAPHYFALSEEATFDYDTNKKMNPPLRSKADVQAIKQGLRDGTIDTIASDHAPHTENEKEIEFDRAEFGVIGLETELAVGISELVETGLLSWKDFVGKVSFNPARILGLKKGTLAIGADADIIVVSADKEWIVGKEGFVSQSKNSAFLGRRLKGLVDYTICAGRIAYRSEGRTVIGL